jgi:uncharacterized membrane protein
MVIPMTAKQKPMTALDVLVKLLLSGIMASLVTVATVLVQIPNPATGGYINFGEIMIFVSALIFGPVVGGFAGGVGSFFADIAFGYGLFAPYTLVIKGIEGVIAGSISNRFSVKRDALAVVLAGSVMVIGYFLAEFYPLQLGWAALTEVPGNILQIIVGAVVGIPVTLALRKRLPEILRK